MVFNSQRRCWILICLLLPALAAAEPFKPTLDSAVLERLPSNASYLSAAKIRASRAQMAAHPTDLQFALRTAQHYINLARLDGDPRYLGYAEAALKYWWAMPHPPVQVRLLRATIRQSNHEFDTALTDLSMALKSDPANPQIWLTRSAVYQVVGRYSEARRDCLALLRVSDQFVSSMCLANIASVTGQARVGYQLLKRALSDAGNVSDGELQAAYTQLAEIAQRLGDNVRAERHYQQAVALPKHDAYVKTAYADFLLDQHKPEQVLQLLRGGTASDAVLLRVALAKQMLLDPSVGADITALQNRFDASRLRGDTVHRREQARFALHLLKQPQQALRLAQANWQVQREPADARILLEAALAARDIAAARPMLAWIQQSRLEDQTIGNLLGAPTLKLNQL